MYDISMFFMYFMFLLVAIALLYRVTGNVQLDSAWNGLSKPFMYILYTFQNAIGNIQAADVSYWQETNLSNYMIFLIYTIWFMN